MNDPIKHVVVLMLENHFFDQMLGCFQGDNRYLEGVDEKNLRWNEDSYGRVFRQRRSDDPVVDPDPMHTYEHVKNQLANDNGGFISEYENEYPSTTPEQRQKIMDYFGHGDLSALHALAQEFTICDHWYSSVPGPTWTNRFFMHSGTSRGRVAMPEGGFPNAHLYLGYNQDTIYDRLNAGGISWRIYYGDVPQSLVLKHQRDGNNPKHYRDYESFVEDVAAADDRFPAYTFIEPRYFHLSFTKPQNDDHPPHSTVPAQALLAEVYNSLRSNEVLWKSTLLVVLYDEHGGFYDHVAPPDAVAPDNFVDEWTFDRLGVRVPAILVSPWIGKGVLPTRFDHASLLKYISDKWGLKPLTARVDAALSFRTSLLHSMRNDTIASVPSPKLEMASAMPEQSLEQIAEPQNENQRALLEFSEMLEHQVPVTGGSMKAARPQFAETAGETAKRRVDDFLAAKKIAN